MWFFICLVLVTKAFEGQATLVATAYLLRNGISFRNNKVPDNYGIIGQINFTQEGKGQPVMVTVDLTSWPPESDPNLLYNYGFHVHELGNLGQNCMLAGNHFNPKNMTHGYPNDTASLMVKIAG
uniref:Superoxide dismutase copper/zinc binding domain-containing protein n=1 Tax=Romanomermis culicivorax TaxID=13658 RepID=A0A915IVS3_ROMCU